MSKTFVENLRPEASATVANAPATRTTSDGRQYPATRRTSKPATPEEEEAAGGGFLRLEPGGESGHDPGAMNAMEISKRAEIDCALYVRFMDAQTVETGAHTSAHFKTPFLHETIANIG